MRGMIIDSLFDRMAADPDVYFLYADMGINMVERFHDRYPDRVLNVGIAEQNLIGVGAGLCNAGFKPFVYTISNFLIHRCFEQIRNDVGIHQYPVTLVGTSTGFDNAPLGPTHHILDDWGVLKALPGFDIYCPSGVAFARTIVDRVIAAGRPAYVRVPKGGFAVPDSTADAVLLPGTQRKDVLVSYGSVAQNCLAYQAEHPEVAVLVLNKLHPLPEGPVLSELDGYERAVIVEDHFAASGLYGSLCQHRLGRPAGPRLISLAPSEYPMDVGASPAYFHRRFGLDPAGIASALS